MATSTVRELSNQTMVQSGEIRTIFTGHNKSAAGQIALLHERISELESQIQQFRDVLEELVDVQNGPPLVLHAAEWNKIMVRAAQLLDRPDSVKFYKAAAAARDQT